MNTLNRSAITISYKKPFIVWSNKLIPELQLLEDMHGESKTYLFAEIYDNAEKLMKKHFKVIFESELEGTWTDLNDWPQKRTYKLFNEWFEYQVSDVVIDMSTRSLYL